MNRLAAAGVIGAIVSFYIAVIAIGYAHFGALPTPGKFRPISSTRTLVVAVTPAGSALGLRVGDVIDRTRLDLASRQVTRSFTGIAGTHYSFDVLRGRGTATVSFVLPAATNRTLRDSVDTALRIMMMLTGLLLIARGRDRLSLYAGLWFAAFAISQGYSHTFAAVGPVGVVVLTAFGGVASVATHGFRVMFAYELLPRPTAKATGVWFLGALAALLAVLAATSVYTVVTATLPWQITTSAIQPIRQASQLGLQLLTLVIAGVAAFTAAPDRSRSLRIIFWSLLLAMCGTGANEISIIAGGDAPFNGALNLGYLIPAVAIPYVLFTRRLAAVDFYVSKAAIYAIVLSVIVGVFVLLESLVERLALGRTESIILQLIVPLALGLSLKRIEHGVEGFVERVLYRDKLSAAEQLNALIDDFPHMHATDVLMRRVVEDVHDLMRCPSAVLYRLEDGNYLPVAESDAGSLHAPIALDDAAFVRLRSVHRPIETTQFRTALPGDGVLIPLVVFGSITGALYCRYRESREHYDPDEIAMLSRLTHELAVAIVWMDGDKASELSARR